MLAKRIVPCLDVKDGKVVGKEVKEVKFRNHNGVILGKSLLDGKFTIEEAIACWPNA